MARPPIDIDENLVRKLARIHCTMDEIAMIVGCSVDTLERRFADTIKAARSRGKMSLRRWQWKSARLGNTGMLVWLGKQYLDQKDQIEQVVDDKRIKFLIGWGDETETDPINSETANSSAKANQ